MEFGARDSGEVDALGRPPRPFGKLRKLSARIWRVPGCVARSLQCPPLEVNSRMGVFEGARVCHWVPGGARGTKVGGRCGCNP
mmetsp:Transcript_7528/g.11890  ORF Transcript_7528/g.11890 Transcript_7528/m.11890 type:complete len:83 (+) Transcript_7528:285-533(+)